MVARARHTEPSTPEQLIRVWRVIAAMVCFQLAGGGVGLIIDTGLSWFDSMWCCGVAATLPGYVVGLVWQLRSCGDRKAWLRMVVILGLAAAGMTAALLGLEFPRMQMEAKRLEAIGALRDERIVRIDVYDEHGDRKLATISDPDAMAGFCRGIADAVRHSPNHPGYTHSWYVVVYGTANLEMQLHLERRSPRVVVGYHVAKSGRRMSLYGSFTSRGLRPWVEEHLVGKVPGE